MKKRADGNESREGGGEGRSGRGRELLGCLRIDILPFFVSVAMGSTIDLDHVYHYMLAVMHVKVHVIFNLCTLLHHVLYVLASVMEKKPFQGGFTPLSLEYLLYTYAGAMLLGVQYLSGLIAIVNCSYLDIAILVLSVQTQTLRNIIRLCEALSRHLDRSREGGQGGAEGGARVKREQGREHEKRATLVEVANASLLALIALKVFVWTYTAGEIDCKISLCFSTALKKIGLVVAMDRAMHGIEACLQDLLPHGAAPGGARGLSMADRGFITSLASCTSCILIAEARKVARHVNK